MSVGDVVYDVSRGLDCPGCRGPMYHPRVLPCKHALCGECIARLVSGAGGSTPGRRQVRCSVCRTGETFSLPRGLDDLPEPLTTKQLKSRVKKLLSSYQDHGTLRLPCSMCAKSQAVYRCSMCPELTVLCTPCRSKHSNKYSREHKTVLISKWTFCAKHAAGRRLSSGYCKTCRAGLCSHCMDNDHADHDVIANDDVSLISSKKKQLATLKQYYQRDYTYFAEYKIRHDESLSTLCEQYNDTSLILEDVREKINAKIDRMQEDLAEKYKKEQETLKIHGATIERIKLMTETLLIYIRELEARNAAGDIDVAVDDLKVINVNTCPRRPKVKPPKVNDYDHVLRAVGDLVPDIGVMTSMTPVTPESGFENTWSREFDASAVCWDEKETGWWIRQENALVKVNVAGKPEVIIGKDILKHTGSVTMDTKRDTLVTTDNDDRIIVLTRSGGLVAEIKVPGGKGLSSVDYCPHRDMYVVGGIGEGCLWMVDAEAGAVLSRLGGEEDEGIGFSSIRCVIHQTLPVTNTQYHRERCPTNYRERRSTVYSNDTCINGSYNANPTEAIDTCQSTPDDTCQLLVSDSEEKCIKLVNPRSGEIKILENKDATGAPILHGPGDLCADAQGQVLICDTTNNKVLCCWGTDTTDEGLWGEVLRGDTLGGCPQLIGLSTDGQHLLIGIRPNFDSDSVILKGFMYDRT